MKNIVRICTVVLAVGLCLYVGGRAAGGRFYSSYQRGALRPWGWNGQYGVQIGGKGPEDEPDDFDTPERVGTGRQRGSVWEPHEGGLPDALDELDEDDMDDALDEMEDTLENMQFTKLDIELGTGNYSIVSGDGFGIVNGGGEWLTSWAEDGVWHIETHSKWFDFVRKIGEHDCCVISLPEDCTLEKIKISAGAANVSFDAPLAVKKAEIEVGAGNLEISSWKVDKKLDIDVGMGNLELGLAGGLEDYRIETDVAMGNVSVNNVPLVIGITGTASKGEGPCKISADLGMGNIDIFTEE